MNKTELFHNNQYFNNAGVVLINKQENDRYSYRWTNLMKNFRNSIELKDNYISYKVLLEEYNKSNFTKVLEYE